MNKEGARLRGGEGEGKGLIPFMLLVVLTISHLELKYFFCMQYILGMCVCGSNVKPSIYLPWATFVCILSCCSIVCQ